MNGGRLPPLDVVDQMPPEDLPSFAAQANALAYRAALRLAVADRPGPGVDAGDQLLTVEQAAERLCVKVDWLRRQRALPFRVDQAPGTVRYSVAGLERWVRAHMGKGER
jgi:hypothetical protein